MDNTRKYCVFNGELLPDNSPIIYSNNRAFLYGDALFETVRCKGSVAPFLKEHYQRLTQSMNFFSMNFQEQVNFQYIENCITRLLNKERSFKGSRIRITVFRNSGGKYTPTDNSCSFIITSEPLNSASYSFSKMGKRLTAYPNYCKSSSPIGNHKTNNALPHVMAGTFLKHHDADDLILFNEKIEVCEALSSNIFTLKGDKLYTPPLSSGCLNGTMRKRIIKNAPLLGLTAYDNKTLVNDDLLNADEIWLCNAITGVQWASAYERRRYFYATSKKMQAIINEQFQVNFD